ncbi:MAG: 23S rRNA (guanosine(2251)-2'-O)-methyltransferase RlmB [Deltaproteobacteria bacterium]|nr:MAG: 23S rRNA (guanosine(2251)-2'-O)-methyltransferase RlmB [Deltaproteobacteria bacterium]
MKDGKLPKRAVEKRIKIGPDLLWGVHPVFEALSSEPGRISEVILLKDKKGGRIEALIKLARTAGVKLNFVDRFRLVGENAGQIRHQGVAARTMQTSLMPFGQLLDLLELKLQQGQSPSLMVCDRIQDPHNLGAIIRSALAAGMDGILLTKDHSAPLGGAAAKSSAGAMPHINISQVSNLADALGKLKKIGAWIYGAVKEPEAVSLYDTDLTGFSCLVVGSEGKGIRPLIRKQCDLLISIPMQGGLDSLNSSVAAGIIMFEMMRQRHHLEM